MATETVNLEGVQRRLVTGLAEAVAKGDAAWSVGGAKHRMTLGAIDKGGNYVVYASWYRPEAYSDDDLSTGGYLPPVSGQTRVVRRLEVASLDDPAVAEMLRDLPATIRQQLARWYPAAAQGA